MIYYDSDIGEFEGTVSLEETLANVAVLMEIRLATDNSLIATLLDTTYNFVAGIEVSFATLNGGTNPIWDTTGQGSVPPNGTEYYFLLTLSHANLSGDLTREQYFNVLTIVPILSEIEVNTDLSVYKEGDTVTITGLLKSTEQVYGANVLVEVRDRDDDSLIDTLLNKNTDLPKDVEVTLDDIAGGVIHWE